MNRFSMHSLVRLLLSPVPTCSTNCDGDLPDWNFDDCNPQVNFAEIRRIFIRKKNSTPFTDWTQPAEWLAQIANGTIKVLTVIADKPAAAGIVKEISNGRRITIGKDHTINFTIDDVSDENYEAMRQMECGGEYLINYETEGEKMFGGNEGITVRVDANNVLGRGRDEIETIVGTFTWRAKFHPERITSPIFGTSSDSLPNYAVLEEHVFNTASLDWVGTAAGETLEYVTNGGSIKLHLKSDTGGNNPTVERINGYVPGDKLKITLSGLNVVSGISYLILGTAQSVTVITGSSMVKYVDTTGFSNGTITLNAYGQTVPVSEIYIGRIKIEKEV